jgi:Ser/Thr protein kinase RdoA (MazF antagonist)
MRERDGTPYADLSPERVLDAVASAGFEPDGRLLALNSYENRVYQIGLDDGTFVVAKFYRPNRWTDAQIGEEHAFTAELVESEVSVVAPLLRDGVSLFRFDGYRFAVFPRRGGRPPELESADNAAWMGRTLGRCHLIGARSRFAHRPSLTPETHALAAMDDVLDGDLLPRDLESRYQDAIDAAYAQIKMRWDLAQPLATLRLHGDCHAGNVLWLDTGPVLVDFDDARTGPAVQDLFMLFDGEPRQRDAMLEGYEQFKPFERAELALIPALRLLRQIHYAGWLSQRWRDPAFPAAFPWAAQARWWEEHLNDVMNALDDL